MKLKVLVDASKKESEKENQSIYVDDPNIDLECCAYLYPKVYEKIFRKKKKIKHFIFSFAPITIF